VKKKHPQNEEGQLELEIFSALRKVTNAIEIYSSKLKDKTGLNTSHLSCLLVLDKTGPISLSQLSKNVSLSPSMITSIVDQLEGNGLVVRNRKSTDRRVILIELTEKGSMIAKNAPPSFQEQFMSALNTLGEEEKHSLFNYLNRLLSLIVSEVLIDSSLLGGENRLVEVEPSVLSSQES
jgi:DNA-binding MarR family transcriptional regulator